MVLKKWWQPLSKHWALLEAIVQPRSADVTRIVHYYARFYVGESGVTQAISQWARVMQHLVHVEIWSAKVAGTTQSELSARQIWHIGWSRNTWLPLSIFWKLRKSDLLYIHEGWTLSNAVAVTLARLRGVRTVLMPHGAYERQIVTGTRDFLGLRFFLERFVIRQCWRVHLFYASEAAAVEALCHLEPDASIVFPNGAPDSDVLASWQGDGDYFVWMGRFDIPHKGLDLLLARWAELDEPRPNLRLAGPDYNGGKSWVSSFIRNTSMDDSVLILNAVSGAQKEDLMIHARGYIHSSRWESCSITLLEFLAIGAPVGVSSSIHAAPELARLGVAAPVDMTATGSFRTLLPKIDTNRSLGSAAGEWVRLHGTWYEIGCQYLEWLRPILASSTGHSEDVVA